MTTFTMNLESDHDYILMLIGVMERIAQFRDPDTGHLEEIVNVIRGFADDIHHAKEERILFPMMVKTGFSAEAGPIVVMLYEHFMGREFANCIASHLEKYKKREEGAVHEICANMLGYASLLKRHIFNENNIVFPTAAGIISENEQEQLLSAFRRAEQANEKHLSRDEYIAVIKNLAGLYP